MDLKLLILNVVAGSLVLLTYIYYLPLIRKNNVSLDAMWGQIKGIERDLTYVSMIASAFAFLYVLYRVVTQKKKNSKTVYLGYSIFFVGAILWAPLLYYYFLNKNEFRAFLMILALCITSVGVIIILAALYSQNKNDYVLLSVFSIFFFHIIYLDNINYGSRFIN